MTIFDFIASLFTATFITAFLRATTPLLLATLGGLISDLAGVINIALEGIMLTAAFFGVVSSAGAAILWPGLEPTSYALIGAAVGVLSGLLLTLILAFFHLEFDADLIIAGIGVNILAAGLTIFLLSSISGDKGSSAGLTSYALPLVPPGPLADIPVIGALFSGSNGQGNNVMVYVALLAVPLVWILIYRTRLGLRLRAAGENPAACETVGIPIKRLRYIALLLSGLLASLGGIYLSMGYLTFFQANMTAGRGFVAIAAIFLGARTVIGSSLAAAFFGFAAVLAVQLSLLGLSSNLVLMIAPAVAILSLLLSAVVRHLRARQKAGAAVQSLLERRRTERETA